MIEENRATFHLDDLPRLTDARRLEARQLAETSLKKRYPEPKREDYSQHTAAKYPLAVTLIITVLCAIVLLVAFAPSAIRLQFIASETFDQAFGGQMNRNVSELVGLANVGLAEIGQIVFSLALATLGAKRSSRFILYGGMLITTVIALVGNIQVALPGHTSNPFAWLEALAPPVLVLGTAYVLKEQILQVIERRHSNEFAYQQALHTWQSSMAVVDNHASWKQFYITALRDVYTRTYAKKLHDITLSGADWATVVYRELQADSWHEKVMQYQTVAEPVVEQPEQTRVKTVTVKPVNPTPAMEVLTALPSLSSNGNGHNGNGKNGH